ncbi:IS1380 family transposase [Amycolatopsis sulphurea]|uniref:IS1380 family transposase n=2 Tax=Amycolatopsis sulphurea TaxID=76022 RepID=UPI000BF58B31|nr:IS1380 family transposase [Amycolatopsis sulphurea]
MRLWHRWSRASVRFDEENLVSCAGLVPVMALAERAGMSQLVAEKVEITNAPIPSTGANPAGKIAAIVAGMVAGADCIDDLDVIRHGGMKRLFSGVYAPSTLGSFLRSFTHGHVLQLTAVLRAMLATLAMTTPVLAGAEQMTYVDIDSLLRRVYGKKKRGARFGPAKVGGYSLLLRGLSPLVATISTPLAAPLIAAMRLRGGNAGSARGAAGLLAEALNTAKASGARGMILVRADSAYYAGTVVSAARRAAARFSITVTGNSAIQAAIATIPDDAWIPVRYPGAVEDPDTGKLISDAEVAETVYTAFAGTSHEVTARLVVRRVKDQNHTDVLFPVWRYHAFLTDTALSTVEADLTHRRHAVVETTFADLIDGPLAHLPSGHFDANAAWAVCAAISHNLLRATGSTASIFHTTARGATLRRHLVCVPARLARPQGREILHLPGYWPWADAFAGLHDAATRPPPAA